MAPTASSMAKKSRIPVPTFSPLNVKGKDREKETGKEKQATGSLTSPRVQGRIFSQPLTSPMAKPAEPHISLGAAAATLATAKPAEPKIATAAATTATTTKPPIPPKPKVMPGRRPHISRAKVIAKLASQREAQQGGPNPTPRTGAPSSHASIGVPKVRSSMNANIGRQSHGVARAGASGDVMMSAKKRTRRSEYARRRSRVDGDKMSVDG